MKYGKIIIVSILVLLLVIPSVSCYKRNGVDIGDFIEFSETTAKETEIVKETTQPVSPETTDQSIRGENIPLPADTTVPSSPETTRRTPETTSPVTPSVTSLLPWVRVDADGNEDSTGEFIRMGSFPQKLVEDKTLIAKLNAEVGDLPNADNNEGWCDYGYYIKDTKQSFMWYKDVSIDGAKYRAVYFTSYRPFKNSMSATATHSYQDENGYDVGNVYWFEFNDLIWNIIDFVTVDGKQQAIVLCNSIINAMSFSVSEGSVYEYSMLHTPDDYYLACAREWLITSFIKEAFTDEERTVLEGIGVSNKKSSAVDFVSLASTDILDNVPYFSNEIDETDTGRQLAGSDYAKAQGLLVEQDGYSYWYTSTPYGNSSEVYAINNHGRGINSSASHNEYGIVPSLRIVLG